MIRHLWIVIICFQESQARTMRVDSLLKKNKGIVSSRFESTS